MKLSQTCIERPVLSTVMSLVIVLFGLIAISRLPNREYPDVDPPVVAVTTVLPGAAPEVIETSVTQPLDQYRLLGEKLNSQVDPVASSVTNSLAQASRALVQLRGAADDLRSMFRPEAPLRQDLDQLLQQLSGTAESISALVEFLKQHPNALITGRELLPKKP